jgi:hypothetical protein
MDWLTGLSETVTSTVCTDHSSGQSKFSLAGGVRIAQFERNISLIISSGFWVCVCRPTSCANAQTDSTAPGALINM